MSQSFGTREFGLETLTENPVFGITAHGRLFGFHTFDPIAFDPNDSFGRLFEKPFLASKVYLLASCSTLN